MKKFFLSIAIILSCLHQQLSAQDLQSEFLLDLEADLNAPTIVGPVPTGTRVIFVTTGGTVKGTRINGKVLPGGGDWGLVTDSTFKLDVRVSIQTDDGAIIYMTYSGYIHSDAKKFAAILGGKGSDLSPSDYYFRTNPLFETGSAKYAWLNHTVAIGIGKISVPGKVNYRIYAIK